MGRPRGSRNRTNNGEFGPHSDQIVRNTVSPEVLRSYIWRIETANVEIKELSDDRKEIFAEFKANGYDVKTLRTIIRRRAMDPDVLASADALLDMYMAAIGDLAGTPLGEAGADRVRAGAAE